MQDPKQPDQKWPQFEQEIRPDNFFGVPFQSVLLLLFRACYSVMYYTPMLKNL